MNKAPPNLKGPKGIKDNEPKIWQGKFMKFRSFKYVQRQGWMWRIGGEWKNILPSSKYPRCLWTFGMILLIKHVEVTSPSWSCHHIHSPPKNGHAGDNTPGANKILCCSHNSGLINPTKNWNYMELRWKNPISLSKYVCIYIYILCQYNPNSHRFFTAWHEHLLHMSQPKMPCDIPN